MPTVGLRYGHGTLGFEFEAGRFEVLGGAGPAAQLTDAEIGSRLDSPVGSPPLEDLVAPGDTVLIVVPDATRRTGSDSIVNLLVRRLIANGTMPYGIRIIFATGIHRPVTDAEKRELLTPFIVQRIQTADHKPRDLMHAAGLGSNSFDDYGEIGGIPVRLNKSLKEFDRTIIVGGVGFHYFAGFTGGRKLICPGLAAETTIAATHRLAFDFESKTRRAGVGPGLLDGNPVHEAFDAIASRVAPTFAVNTIVDDEGRPTAVHCGDWRESHRAACLEYANAHRIEIDAKRDLVVVSCGGSPYDVNLIQAHKALAAAAGACREGGRIVFVAECADGAGRNDFGKWFSGGGSGPIAERLCEAYEVNGQTAWSLARLAERFDVRIVTSLDSQTVSPMGLRKCATLEEAVAGSGSDGFILPFGARYLVSEG